METNKIQVVDCKENWKQTGYILSCLQRNLLCRVYQLEQENGFAIRKNFHELSQRKFYYNVDILTKRGYLESSAKNSKQLITTNKGKQYIRSILGDLQTNIGYVTPFMDRAHKITIKQPVIQRGKIPDGFVTSTKSNKLNWKDPQLIKIDNENNLTIRATPGTMVYSFRECYSIDAHHSVAMRLDIVFRYSRMLAEEGWKLDIPNTTVVDQHHAIFGKELGRLTRHYNIHYKSDRMTFDSSINSNEFELISPDHAEDDFSRLSAFWEAIARGELKLPVLLTLQESYLQSGKNEVLSKKMSSKKKRLQH